MGLIERKRRPDWQSSLTAYISECRGKPFEWGKLDCALFACGAVKAQTGVDLARGWRGYRTAAGSVKKLRKAGFADVEEAAAAVLPRADRLRPGYVAVVETLEGPALGVVQGRMIYVMTLEFGMQTVPLADAIGGFKV